MSIVSGMLLATGIMAAVVLGIIIGIVLAARAVVRFFENAGKLGK